MQGSFALVHTVQQIYTVCLKIHNFQFAPFGYLSKNNLDEFWQKPLLKIFEFVIWCGFCVMLLTLPGVSMAT